MVTVFFRYDDYSALSRLETDAGVIDVFRRNGLCCTFSVIPAVSVLYPWVEGADKREVELDRGKIELLRGAVAGGAVEVALHGWNHLANAFTGHPTPSEFKGLPFDAQVQILERGRNFLAKAAGAATKIFVPPWNSYDDTTEAALEHLGFEVISASRYAPKPRPRSRLKFVPMTTEILGLRSAVAKSTSGNTPGAVIGIMMHPYDFLETGDSRGVISLEGFEEEIRWLKNQPGVRIASIGSLAGADDTDGKRYKANRPSVLEVSYPPFVKGAGSDPLYHVTSVARRQTLKRDSAFALLMVALVAIGMMIGAILEVLFSRTMPQLTWVVPVIAAAAGAALSLRSLKQGALYFRPAAVVAVAVGVALSALLS